MVSHVYVETWAKSKEPKMMEKEEEVNSRKWIKIAVIGLSIIELGVFIAMFATRGW
jgi:hypothetical protein